MVCTRYVPVFLSFILLCPLLYGLYHHVNQCSFSGVFLITHAYVRVHVHDRLTFRSCGRHWFLEPCAHGHVPSRLLRTLRASCTRPRTYASIAALLRLQTTTIRGSIWSTELIKQSPIRLRWSENPMVKIMEKIQFIHWIKIRFSTFNYKIG